jgi:hypothetical protein
MYYGTGLRQKFQFSPQKEGCGGGLNVKKPFLRKTTYESLFIISSKLRDVQWVSIFGVLITSSIIFFCC